MYATANNLSRQVESNPLGRPGRRDTANVFIVAEDGIVFGNDS
jgi:hypothetical protein